MLDSDRTDTTGSLFRFFVVLIVDEDVIEALLFRFFFEVVSVDMFSEASESFDLLSIISISRPTRCKTRRDFEGSGDTILET